MEKKATLHMSLQKILARAAELESLRFVAAQDLFPLEGMEDTVHRDAVHTALPVWQEVRSYRKGDDFRGRDRYIWLRKQVSIPAAAQGYVPFGVFDFGVTGEGHNSGFESLLYVNGAPYQGVDSNHQEVNFSSLAGQQAELVFMMWTGLEGRIPPTEQEHRLRRAELSLLHQATDTLYYLLKAVGGTLQRLDQNDPAFAVLLGAAEAALALLDWDEDRLHASVPPALELLQKRLADAPKHTPVVVNCVGHTHIDVAWLWRLKHTREKAMRSFSSVLHLMEEFDDYRFIQSQPQLYKYIQTDAPELYERIKRCVAEGRWEPEGGMWLEADCNISSGEALARQFLYGIRFFQKEFGVRCRYLWLPDVFGYSWALPQIMKQCGIETFMTTKIGWNHFNTIPNDIFWWKGLDGSQVLTYFIKAPDRDEDWTTRASTYNGRINPSSVLGAWHRFQNKEITNEVLLSYGLGDGGGGPTRDMLQMRRALDTLPGVPQVRQKLPGEFFRELHEKVSVCEAPVHTWDGELYLENHRGTYTSQAASKRWNRRTENNLTEAETLSVVAGCKGLAYPKAALDDAWEILLLNQFHDIIPGSSIHEVYEDSMVQYQEADAVLQGVRQAALGALVRSGRDRWTVWNPSTFPRKELLEIPCQEDGAFYCGDTALTAEKTPDGYRVAATLPGLSFTALRFVPGETQQAPVSFTYDLAARVLQTPFYQIRWAEDGTLCEVYDKTHGRHALDGVGNRLECYEDKPLDYENWDVDYFYDQKRELLHADGAPEVVECGLRLVLRFTYRYRKSTFTQDMICYADHRRIDFVTHAHWQESRRLLKAAFDMAVRSSRATYDIQYGHAERPTHRNTSWDMARFEVMAHKWADVSEENYGVSLLNDSKYGYSALGSTLCLTLLKSGKSPDPQADMGEHCFTYSLLPHGGVVTQGDTIAQSHALNLPLRVAAGEPVCPGPLLQMDSDAVVVDAIKQAEDGNGIVVRLHECKGGHRRVCLTTPLPAAQIQPCNILEEPEGDAFAPAQWEVDLAPFQIKNFRLTQLP